MQKGSTSVLAASLFVVLTGCGGSGNVGSTSDPAGGVPLSQYQATLPDGSPMELEIFADDGVVWSGDFAVAATTGPYAYQTGSFQGKIVSGAANATGELGAGGTFQLTGTDDGDAGFRLTRSDIPGVVLNFTKVAAPIKPKSYATVTFKLNANGPSGQVALSNTPYSNDGVLAEYRGTWQNCKVTFWAYTSGYTDIVISINDYAIYDLPLNPYRLSDFSRVTRTTSAASMSVWNPVSQTSMKYLTAATTVSPG